MAYPSTVPSGTRLNTTPQVNLHPGDHNEIHAALTDIINELGSNPSGDSASVTAFFALLNPVGEIKMYGGASAPAGWALCNGDAVSRGTYADLFAIIGTTFGVGDGSTTFNLPDLRNRFAVGKGAGTWSDVLGEIGGAADAVAVAHVHGQPTHVHSTSTDEGQGLHVHERTGTDTEGNAGYLYRGGDGAGWETLNGEGDVTGGDATPSVSNAGSDHVHTATSSANGDESTNSQLPQAAATNANLPPYLTVNFIIRLT